MKKLVLLLAALGVMSATTFAEEPTLKVTSIGQEVEIENTSGAEDIGESVFFGTMVNLSYGDWTFGVTGAKIWGVDTEDITSNNGRVQLDAMKNFGDLKVGVRYRGQKNYDRYYGRLQYSKGFFWSNWDVWYESKTDSPNDNDTWRGEVFPIGLQYNGFRIGWFIDAEMTTGSVEEGNREDNFEHQIRIYAPLYKGEKLTLKTQIRQTLTVDDSYKGRAKDNKSRYEDFGRTRVYLESNYQVNESLNVYLNYGYEFREKEFVNSGKSDESDNYFGDLIFGWNYKF